MVKKWLIISLTGLILLTLIAACAQSTTPEPVTVDTRSLISEKCGVCHSADRVFQADYTEEEWSAVFDDMINKGADVTPEEKSAMIDWLLAQD
jgi:hypothetical protein